MEDDLPLAGQAVLLLTAAGVCLGVLAAAAMGWCLLKLDGRRCSRR